VTEELWGYFKQKDAGMLIKHPWPVAPLAVVGTEWEKARSDLQAAIDVISAIRKIRAEQGVEAGKPVNVIIHTDKYLDLIQSQREHIVRMAKVGDWTLDAVPKKHENAASIFLPDIEIHVPLEGLIDPKAMKKEQAELKKYVGSLEAKLSNKAFTAKAPAHIVDDMKQKLAEAKEKLAKIGELLK
jgi:valyl-tRNA synthetase